MGADELIANLEETQQGVPPFAPGLAEKLLAEFSRLAGSATLDSAGSPPAAAETAVLPPLTERQREVLQLIASGLTYKEAGARLGLSSHTVKYHMAEIMAALHLEHRAQLLAYVGKQGLGEERSSPNP